MLHFHPEHICKHLSAATRFYLNLPDSDFKIRVNSGGAIFIALHAESLILHICSATHRSGVAIRYPTCRLGGDFAGGADDLVSFGQLTTEVGCRSRRANMRFVLSLRSFKSSLCGLPLNPMQIGKISATFAGGIVITGGVVFDSKLDFVRLPPKLDAAVTSLQEGDCVPVFTMTADGRKYDVFRGSDGLYAAKALDEVSSVRWFLRGLMSLVFPTDDQSQQMGRSMHALGVASTVGAVGLGHSYGLGWWTLTQVGTVFGLLFAAVLLFLQGNLLMEPSK